MSWSEDAQMKKYDEDQALIESVGGTDNLQGYFSNLYKDKLTKPTSQARPDTHWEQLYTKVFDYGGTKWQDPGISLPLWTEVYNNQSDNDWFGGDNGLMNLGMDIVGYGLNGVANAATYGGWSAAQSAANSESEDSSMYSNAAKAGAKGYLTQSVNSSDPYGYGNSVGGQAGTAATTAGLSSAASGDSTSDQLKKATIAGASTGAGAYATQATADSGDPWESNTYDGSQYRSDGTAAGQLASVGTNMALQQALYPNKTPDYSYLYGLPQQGPVSSYDQPMVPEALNNTPEGSQLYQLFQQEMEQQKRQQRAGGANQFAQSNDQVYSSNNPDYITG